MEEIDIKIFQKRNTKTEWVAKKLWSFRKIKQKVLN